MRWAGFVGKDFENGRPAGGVANRDGADELELVADDDDSAWVQRLDGSTF